MDCSSEALCAPPRVTQTVVPIKGGKGERAKPIVPFAHQCLSKSTLFGDPRCQKATVDVKHVARHIV